ncbi:MAG: DUF418 domain-containing protein [Bacteroidales bacterium]
MNLNVKPVSRAERIVLLDALRGLAIFGILMVNLPLMYKPITSMLFGSNMDGSLINMLSESFIKFFFEGKFYVLFSMLFGYGFWLFINKKTEEGKSIVPVFRRRVFFLFLFGALHVILLWAGDILVFYALFGFILLLFRRVSDRGLIKWAIWIAIIPSALAILGTLMVKLASLSPVAAAEMNEGFAESINYMKGFAEKTNNVYSTGSFSEIVTMRLTEYRVLLPGVLFFYPVVLAMFLVGVWSARKGLISNYRQHLPLFKKIFWWGLGIGIVANAIYAISYQYATPLVPGTWEAVNSVTHTAGGISFGFFYASAMVLMYAKGKTYFVNLLAPVGRMALTNYLMHSIIAVVLFHPYGFGLFGKIEAWQGVLLAFGIFSLQIPFSIIWLRTFRFGPFEWLWRSLTYMKVQPFIRKE